MPIPQFTNPEQTDRSAAIDIMREILEATLADVNLPGKKIGNVLPDGRAASFYLDSEGADEDVIIEITDAKGAPQKAGELAHQKLCNSVPNAMLVIYRDAKETNEHVLRAAETLGKIYGDAMVIGILNTADKAETGGEKAIKTAKTQYDINPCGAVEYQLLKDSELDPNWRDTYDMRGNKLPPQSDR